jgi:hypothetical protein
MLEGSRTMLKILAIGNINTIFTFEYVTEILSDIPEVKIDIATFCDDEKEIVPERLQYCRDNEINIVCLGKYVSRKKIISALGKYYEKFKALSIVKNYDIVQFLFVNSVESFLVCKIAPKSTRIVSTFYGSDLLRAKAIDRLLLNKVLKRSDCITLGSENMIQAFERTFDSRYLEKCVKADLGSNNAPVLAAQIDNIDKAECKKRFGIPEDKLSIFCGYNGRREHRHIQIIEELMKMDQSIKDKVCLVFHCGYELADSYKTEILQSAEKSGIEYVMISEYLKGIELAKVRKAADIMLNLQVSDALSNSMMENIYAGAVVVKGTWLDYPDLDKAGVYTVSINSMNDLLACISEIVENYNVHSEKCVLNKEPCLKLMSWDTYKEIWKKVVNGTVERTEFIRNADR